MAEYRVISSDNHIVEPPDLWLERMEPGFRDQAPAMRDTENGPFWFVEGKPTFNITSMASQAGRRFEDAESLQTVDAWENARPGAYIPEEAIKDMDFDGIDVGIVYPSLTIFLYAFVEGSELLSAILRAYNGFAAEYCQAQPRRLKGVATINIDDVAVGVEELKRCAKLGFVGAAIPEYMSARPYFDEANEPLWATAQDLGMPLGLHISTARVQAGRGWDRELDAFGFSNLMLDNADFWVRVSLTEMILSGVFERYPDLRVGVAEHELNWVPYWIERMDYSYSERAAGREGFRLKNNMAPSDVFHSNCFVDFQEDALGITHRDIIGVDNIMWGSDYPHTEGTFPKSREFIETTLADCTQEEKEKIVAGNAARIYGL